MRRLVVQKIAVLRLLYVCSVGSFFWGGGGGGGADCFWCDNKIFMVKFVSKLSKRVINFGREISGSKLAFSFCVMVFLSSAVFPKSVFHSYWSIYFQKNGSVSWIIVQTFLIMFFFLHEITVFFLLLLFFFGGGGGLIYKMLYYFSLE